MLVLTWS